MLPKRLLSTCAKNRNGCGFLGGHSSRGRMAGSGAHEPTRVKAIRGLNSIRVGRPGCLMIDALTTRSHQDSLTTEWNVASFEIMKWRPVASENSLLTVTTIS